MARPLIGANVRVEVQKTLAAAVAIVSISKANPGVLSTGAVAHGLANGDVFVMTIEDGMVELNQVAARAANITTGATNLTDLEGIDTTTFTTFAASSGTVLQEVTAWDLVGFAREVNLPNAAAADIDVSTLLDTVEQREYGMQGVMAGSIEGLFRPNETSMKNLIAASRAYSPRVFRITWPNGTKAIFNAVCAAGLGFSQPLNGAASTSIPLSVRGFPSFFAS